jgi:hypothetical protein
MEEFRDVPGYEGLYQVSNLGNVKSLPKEWVCGKGQTLKHNGKILKVFKNNCGYYIVGLNKDNKRKPVSVHSIVAKSFFNYNNSLVVDHKNDIKTDNRVENLQLITQRENSRKTQGSYSSKYRGVSWAKMNNKWRAQIVIDRKKIMLGYFTCELKAHLAYQTKLNEIK